MIFWSRKTKARQPSLTVFWALAHGSRYLPTPPEVASTRIVQERDRTCDDELPCTGGDVPSFDEQCLAFNPLGNIQSRCQSSYEAAVGIASRLSNRPDTIAWQPSLFFLQ